MAHQPSDPVVEILLSGGVAFRVSDPGCFLLKVE